MFNHGGIVPGNMPVINNATCFACNNRIDTDYVRGEIFICAECDTKERQFKIILTRGY